MLSKSITVIKDFAAGHRQTTNDGACESLGLNPAESGADLLEQTRLFSRGVNQLQADMEQLLGKSTYTRPRSLARKQDVDL